MSADADVIRYAAPWPGSAAQLLEGFAHLGAGPWTLDQVCASAAAGLQAGDAAPILSGLAMAGVCRRDDEANTWSSQLGTQELQRLAQLLRGAEHFRRLRSEPASFDLVVTMPLAPSFLEGKLPSTPGRPGGYLPTPDAFLRIARKAVRRLVVVTPFIDRAGFGWLRNMLAATGPEVDRIIVLRDTEQVSIELSVENREWLQALDVKVFDYHLEHGRGDRALRLETFHAKLVIADDAIAYVGSANVLGSGDGTSLEAGVLVEGRGAAEVARLVDGILQVARRR
jgi:hypothetical protein